MIGVSANAVYWTSEIGSYGILAWLGWLQLRNMVNVRWMQKTVVGIFVFQIFIFCLAIYGYVATLVNEDVWKYYAELENPFFTRQVMSLLNPLAASWAITAGFFLLMYYVFLKKKRGILLDGTDIMLLVAGCLIVGWPGMLVFFAMVFLFAIVLTLLRIFTRRQTVHDRLIITPVIIPAAIVTFAWLQPLLQWTNLIKIRF